VRDVLPKQGPGGPNKALEFAEDTLSTRSRKKAFAAKFKEAF